MYVCVEYQNTLYTTELKYFKIFLVSLFKKWVKFLHIFHLLRVFSMDCVFKKNRIKFDFMVQW